MKTTLNTILLTSVLAVPTTFGADLPTRTHEPDVNHGTQSVTYWNPLAEFGLASNSNKSFIEWLRFVTTIDFQKSSVTKKDLENAKASIDSLQILSTEQKGVLVTLIDQPAPLAIRKIANDLCRSLDESNYEIPAKLYERAANHSNATVEDFQWAALGVKKLGIAYHGQAAGLHIKSANLTKASLQDIKIDTFSLLEFGSTYYPTVANLLEKLANHSQVTSDDIEGFAYTLTTLGSDYLDRAADLYIRSVSHSKVILPKIIGTVFRLIELGLKNYDKAANLFEIFKKNASPYDMLHAARLAAEKKNFSLMLEMLNLCVEHVRKVENPFECSDIREILKKHNVHRDNKELFEEYMNLERKILQKR
jgi:hypothetical protein